MIIHMPGSIEYLQADNTVTSVGNGIGPETSVSRWHKYHWPFSAGSRLPALYRVLGLGHLLTPSRHLRNSRTSGVPMSGPRSGQEGHVARR